jgi:hypothetical protein
MVSSLAPALVLALMAETVLNISYKLLVDVPSFHICDIQHSWGDVCQVFHIDNM